MGDKAKNIAGLFRDARSRTIIVVTGIALFLAIAIGIYSVRDRLFGTSLGSANVRNAPGGIQSVPFQAPNPEYARLQEQQNTTQAQQAEASGGSAIPTIIRSGNLTQLTSEQQAALQQGGLGFTGLSRVEEAGADFTPKAFNVGGGPAAGDFSSFCNPCVTCGKGGPGINGMINQSGVGIGVPVPNIGQDLLTATPSQLSPMAGTPVYDSQGHLVGTVGVDGKVRDGNGNVVGIAGLDGIVRDANGNVVGQAKTAVTGIATAAGAGGAPGVSSLGTPIYDAQGHLIGYAGPDGKVRDANGNIIGTLGPDGIVRDANGNVVGYAGKPVYDANGHLIGFAGADGKVRDLNGNVVGTVGPDGLVRDANGNIIGKVGGAAAAGPPQGTPVYDANGRLIGYVGADGKVRDANGNIIGTVGPDGLVRDANGNIIGRALTSPPGTPVYDANGRLIGYVGPDGKVRDLQGHVIGTLGPDGLVRDAFGNVIGSTTKAARGTLPISDATYALQMGLGEQHVQALFEQRRGAMAGQSAQLISAWAPPTQAYVQGNEPQQGQGNGAGGAGGQGGSGGTGASSGGGSGSQGGGNSKATSSTFIKAGTVMFATLTTEINSDEPGPVLATVVGGDLQGGRLLGTITNQGQAVMITFNLLTLPNLDKSIPINAVAIDQNTARTGLSTGTDNHYLLRYGSLFASSFLQGYGQAIQSSGTTVSTTGLTTQTATPTLSPKDEIFVALGNVGAQWGNQLNTIFNTPPTVHVKSGTSIGVLYLADVPSPV